MIHEINQGESLFLSYSLDRHTDLSNYTCQVQVRSGDNDELIQEQFFIDYANNQKTFIGYLDVSNTNNLYAGTYSLNAKILNQAGDMARQFGDSLVISSALVSPNLQTIEDLVSFAEAQPTPETQLAAQDAVDQLPVSSEKTAFQVRLDALDPEVANVEAARNLVVIAEAYRWLAIEQADAQVAVDALVSSIERGQLTTRLDALDDKVAAETATENAEYTTLQVNVDAAQVAINVLPALDQILLQARLNAVYVPARFEQADASEFTQVVTPWIDAGGFSVRSPGARVSQKLESAMSPGSGWSSVHLKTPFVRTVTSIANGFWGVGDLAAMAAGDFQNLQSGDRDKAVTAGTDLYFDDVVRSPLYTDVVIAVDYTGAAPHVYVIDVGTSTVVFDTVLNVSTDVDLFTRCALNSSIEREWYYNINTGGDLTNRPFPVDGKAILDAYGVPDTSGYIEGWLGSGTRDANTQTPAVTITSITPAPYAPGDTISMAAEFIDGYGVDRSAEVTWYNKFINWNDPQAVQQGAAVTWDMAHRGYYEIVAEAVDTNGVTHRDTTIVDAWEEITVFGSTRFGSGRSHANIDNLTTNQVRFGTSDPFKLTAAATNAMHGRFTYVEFELRTLDTSAQFGFGLSSLLNLRGEPGVDESIMWSGRDDGLAPQDGAGAATYLEAFSQNDFLGSTWVNGASSGPQGPQPAGADRSNTSFYHGGVNGTESAYLGMAVDYRDITKPPTVYVFHRKFGTGVLTLAQAYVLFNARTPVAPVIYCNQQSNETVLYDAAVNGGLEGTFNMDPRGLLTAAGVDMAGAGYSPARPFIYGWSPGEAQA